MPRARDQPVLCNYRNILKVNRKKKRDGGDKADKTAADGNDSRAQMDK